MTTTAECLPRGLGYAGVHRVGDDAPRRPRVTRAFAASQLLEQDARGVRAEARGRGIGDQVALARGCPATQGARHLGFAHALAEMPHTDALLGSGQISEWTASVLVRESAILTRAETPTSATPAPATTP